jgi:undecaprenyl-phosphate alpha-N-acetylglucosaminyl 1-phosphatetransferase
MQVFIVSMLFCSILILLLRKVAYRLDFVDHPGGRKQHRNATPTVGGLAMFVAVFAALLIGNALYGKIAILLGCAAVLVMLGVLDDKHGLSVSLRLMIQVFLVTVVIVGADGTVTHLGTMFGSDIPLSMFAVPFSIIAFVGGINAINMIDGVDGMAGKMALITMLGVATICYVDGAVELLPLTWAMLGSLVGFLFLNSRLFVKRAWVFMGDSGSMLVGLVLGWFMAQLTHGSVLAEPAVVLWLFGIPLIDTLAVMFRRAKHKRSPFQADRAHIHYLLKHMGFRTRLNVLVLSLAQLILVGIGVIFHLKHVPAWIIFWSFVLLMALYFSLFHKDRTGDRRKNTTVLYPDFDDRRQNTGNGRAGDRRKNTAELYMDLDDRRQNTGGSR